MRPVYISQTAAGATVPVPLDLYVPNFNVSLFVEVDGTVNYTVQYTSDDVFDPAVTPNWTDHSDLTGQTTDQDATIISPVAAVRLVVNSGSGTASLTVRQAGTQ